MSLTVTCERCDTFGPVESGWQQDFLEAHRAWHALTNEMQRPIVPIVEWLARKLDGR